MAAGTASGRRVRPRPARRAWWCSRGGWSTWIQGWAAAQGPTPAPCRALPAGRLRLPTRRAGARCAGSTARSSTRRRQRCLRCALHCSMSRVFYAGSCAIASCYSCPAPGLVCCQCRTCPRLSELATHHVRTWRQATGRRLELLAGRTADAALLALYEEIAAIWRRLHELGDKKSRLQQLRCALCARRTGMGLQAEVT